MDEEAKRELHTRITANVVGLSMSARTISQTIAEIMANIWEMTGESPPDTQVITPAIAINPRKQI